MTIENEAELEAMRRAGGVVATVLEDMLAYAKSGMSTRELDRYGADRLAELGGNSAPMVMYDFPAATCISVNEGIAHGIPGDYVLKDGDMLNVDVSAEVDGFFADNGGTRAMGEPSELQVRLLSASREARDLAIAAIKPGVLFNRVGRIFETVAKDNGFNLVRNLCSHGIGRSLHEAPSMLYPYYDRRDRRRFTDGLVIALEPFLTTGRDWVAEDVDGWTLLGSEGSLSAQFEHTIVVRRSGAEVLTVAS